MSHQEAYKTNIYVLNADGSPLMPMHSQRKARKWIKEGKATVACQVPYTLRLTKQIEDPSLQPVIIGVDPGPNNVGFHAIDKQGRSLLAIDLAADNAQVTKHMSDRASHRRASRAGERKRRQRRQVRIDASSKKVVYERKLPQCDEPIRCKTIRNSKARYCNRTRPAGWLLPTIETLVRTHVNMMRKIARMLPITCIAVENNKFDFTRLKMLDEETWNGLIAPLTGYDSASDYVFSKQGGKCLLCDGEIKHYHHIIGRKRNGANTVGNLVGLCEHCHELVHKDARTEESLLALVSGQEKVFGHLGVLNAAMPFIIARLSEFFDIVITDGKSTHDTREMLGVPKSSGASGHFVDAYCIALAAIGGVRALSYIPFLDDVSAHLHVVRRFRRHDRARVHAQKQRAYRDESGRIVAKNRHKAMGQSGDSLEEYRALHGDAAVSRLSCKPSKRSYKDSSRVLPGTVFVDASGTRHVVSGQSNGRFVSDGVMYPRSGVRVVRRNEGLVFVS